MRKALSISLLAVFSFLLMSPLFALGTSSSRMPMACCRRDGKHHCADAMARAMESDGQGTRVTAPPERCPFCPAGTATAYHGLTAIAQEQSELALLVTRPTGVAQTESKLRISRSRSRQKRGPPAPIVLA